MWKFIAIIVHITAGHKNHIYLCICIRARVSSNPFRLLALVHFTIISIIILIEGRRWIEHQSLHSCKEGSIEQGKMTRCKRKWKCNLVQVLLFLSFSTSLSLCYKYIRSALSVEVYIMWACWFSQPMAKPWGRNVYVRERAELLRFIHAAHNWIEVTPQPQFYRNRVDTENHPAICCSHTVSRLIGIRNIFRINTHHFIVY